MLGNKKKKIIFKCLWYPIYFFYEEQLADFINTSNQKFGVSKIFSLSYAHQGCNYLIKN